MCNFYREAIAALNWNKAIVIGHKTPDGDSVMSALAYAHLMQQLGYEATAKMAGKANNETVYAAKAFNLELPEILNNVEAQAPLILVDHSDYAQAIDGARDARILQVIDHHGIGDITESKLLYAKYMPVGSTCSIVYTSYKELNVEITPFVARILLAGIMSDTLNLVKVTCTSVDRTIYKELVKILAVDENVPFENELLKINGIYKEMFKAAKNFDGMTDEEIFNSDAKDYEIAELRFRLGSLDWNDESSIDSFNQRMLLVMQEIVRRESSNVPYHMAFCRVGFKETSYILYCGSEILDKDGNQSEILGRCETCQGIAERAFGQSILPGVIFCQRRLSRKLDVVPMLTAAIEEMRR